MGPPIIGPADLNPAVCFIASTHGVVTGATQEFRNNPNGYRPRYVAAESQIRNAPCMTRRCSSPEDRAPGAMLARVLGVVGVVGVKKVAVDFS